MSLNEYKDIRPDFDSKTKKRRKSIKSVKVGLKLKFVVYWLGVVDDDSDSVEVKTASSSSSPDSFASTSGRSNSSERTESVN